MEAKSKLAFPALTMQEAWREAHMIMSIHPKAKHHFITEELFDAIEFYTPTRDRYHDMKWSDDGYTNVLSGPYSPIWILEGQDGDDQ